MRKSLLFSLIAVVAISFASCEETGFTFNPKQVHVQVLEGHDYIVNVKGNGHDLNLTEEGYANGFNVKKGQSVLVACVQGDSILVLIGGDIIGDFQEGIYMSTGDIKNVAVN